MPSDLDPRTVYLIVVWGGLALGLVLGAVGQASRFCVRGAIADWVVLRSPGRLVSWLLAIAVGALAVQGLIAVGLLDASRTLYWNDRFPWASYLVGGLLFGYGMMLAGGCPQRCLVKAGQGNLKAAATLVVVAIVALMTLRGALAPLRADTLDVLSVTLAGPQDLGGLLGRSLMVSPTLLRWSFASAFAAAVFVLAWRLRARIDPGHWLGGVAVGLIVGLAFFVTGGVGFLAEHPETLEPAWLGTQSRRPEALSFSAPMAHALDLLTMWTDRSTVATFGVVLSLGVVVGALVTARLRNDFRVESFSTPRELRDHVAGGALMGFGGITALGCSVGNGVTGLAMLSAGSLLAVAGITVGARIALAWPDKAAAGSAAPGAVAVAARG